MNIREAKKAIKVAESLDWSVTREGNEFEFQKYSPAGQDFNMTVSAGTMSGLLDELREKYSGFDCAEEAYLWLGEDGHGKYGAPYDMKDLYEDMEACQEMILELADALKEAS